MTIGYSIIYRCLYLQVCNSTFQYQGLIFGKEGKKKKQQATIKGIAEEQLQWLLYGLQTSIDWFCELTRSLCYLSLLIQQWLFDFTIRICLKYNCRLSVLLGGKNVLGNSLFVKGKLTDRKLVYITSSDLVTSSERVMTIFLSLEIYFVFINVTGIKLMFCNIL